MGTAAPENTPDQSATESLIKSVISDQKRVASRDALPDLEPVEREANTTAQPAKNRFQPRKTNPNARSLKGRILAYRPTRNHILIGAFVIVMILRPWLIPGILFVTFWVGLIAWLTLGPDRMLEWAGNAWDRLSTRNPDLAERLRQRGDAFALRFDAMLDKLPDSWAEKLALPDMSRPLEVEKDLSKAPDPFEKLKLPEVYRG